MKNCLLWGYMHVNLGDDLFFQILFERYPKTKFYIYPPSEYLNRYKKIFKKYKNVIFYDKEPYYIKLRSEIPDEKTPLYIFPMVLERAKKVDCFINVGGSIFIQNDNYKNDDRFKIKEIIGSKPSFIIGCNFGPGDKEFENYYREFFKKFDDICFREKNSYMMFKDLKNVRVADDLVLLKEKTSFLHNNKKNKNTLGISVIDIGNHNKIAKYKDDYINFMVETIKYYINKNMKITLFSFCEDEGDLKIIEEIIDKLNCKNGGVSIVSYKDNIKEFLSKWKSNEFIISTRFHATILALKYNQKFIPLSYSDKTKNYLKDIDSSLQCYEIKDIKNIKIDKIKFNEVNKNFDSYKQFEVIDKYLKGK